MEEKRYHHYNGNVFIWIVCNVSHWSWTFYSGTAGAFPQTHEGIWYDFLIIHDVSDNCVYVSNHADSSNPVILRQILSATQEVTGYYSLGIQLGIHTSYLDQIEKDYGGDAERCKIEVIKFWLRNVQNFTWNKLAQAIEGMGRHANVVQTLKANHEGL